MLRNDRDRIDLPIAKRQQEAGKIGRLLRLHAKQKSELQAGSLM
ncbi:MAG TPA: hypothetical protein VK327_07705 [Candidatus Paceibacterota bacterium]|nr:hypothetical protein [Candidatus Paceibacterota bacterium]